MPVGHGQLLVLNKSSNMHRSFQKFQCVQPSNLIHWDHQGGFPEGLSKYGAGAGEDFFHGYKYVIVVYSPLAQTRYVVIPSKEHVQQSYFCSGMEGSLELASC